MKILVTGHQGYIGSLLVPMLTSLGHQVQGLDSNLFETSVFGHLPAHVPTIQKDIRDSSLEDIDGCEAVIHLAGLSNDPLGDLDPDLTMDINYHATVRLAEQAKKAGAKRFLFASSCSIYGASGSEMIDELSPINPVTPYAHSKYLSEQDLSAMTDDQFSPTHFRCATAHGYSPRIRFDLVVNNIVAWAYTTGKIFIKSDGTPWRPFVHIEDICRSFIAVLEAPLESVHDQVFNVGETAENYQINQVAKAVSEVVPDCQLEYAPGGGPDKRCYKVSCDKITSMLPSYVPQWTVTKSIRNLLDHYASLGLKEGEFEGPKYNRIGHIKELLQKGQIDASLRRI